MAVELPPFVEGLPDGVWCASLPTPFRVGRVNCYLLSRPPVTVIDPGALAPDTLDLLEALLASAGLGITDIDQIVITHPHPDHFGAAAELAARADALIVCGMPDVAGLVSPRDSDAAAATLVRLGVAEETARSLVAAGDRVLARVVRRPDPGRVVGLSDGAALRAGGREYTCVVSAGHTDGHVSLWDPAERVLFSGDHLLARIIPVPSLDPGDGARVGSGFLAYLDGLERFEALDPALVLPGHGRGFTNVGVLAARLRAHSRERADAIATILRDGQASPFDIARRLQWQPEGARLALGLANAQGHLDLLEHDGRVSASPEGEAVRYRLLE